jgi:hypothetical protein
MAALPTRSARAIAVVSWIACAGACYESHLPVAPACDPTAASLVLHDEGCTELVVTGEGDHTCPGLEELGVTAAPVQVANATTAPAIVQLRMDAEAIERPGFDQIDDATCGCSGTTLHLPRTPAGECIGAFAVGSRETVELALHGARNRYRMTLCTVDPGTTPLCD